MYKAIRAQKSFLIMLLLTALFLTSCEEVTDFKSIEWIEVGTEGAPDFQNGWENFSDTHQPLAFGIDQNNMLNIVGVLRDTTPVSGRGSNTIMFTLPEGYRPSETQFATVGAFSSSSTYTEGNIICNMQIQTNGDVYFLGDEPEMTYGMNVRVKM